MPLTLTIHEAQLPDAIDAGIQEIVSLVRQSASSAMAAGKAYVALLEKHSRHDVEERMMSYSVPRSMLLPLERIGRGLCDERLLCTANIGMQRLAYVPIDSQQRALTTGIEYLTTSGSVVTLRADTMSREQAVQVISSSSIRSIEEQRAYQAAQKPKEQKPKGKAYVQDGKIHVSGKCTLTRFELASLMAQMDG